MSTPFLSEIKVVSFNFPPKGWAQCNGQLLPINQNQALFALLGTNFGGNGQTTFALPDLRGRAPLSWGSGSGGSNYTLGQKSGEEAHTLTVSEMPGHRHPISAVADKLPLTSFASGAVIGKKSPSGPDVFAAPSSPPASLSSSSTTPAGGSQAHSNMQPYLVLNFVIALQGVFPSQN